MQLLSRFDDLEPAGDPADRAVRVGWWRNAIRSAAAPCLLSAVTTAGGFLAIGVSDIPPVRTLGLFTAFGVLASFALVFTVLPALLSLSPAVRPRPEAARSWTPVRARAAAERLHRHGAVILALAAASAAAGAVGIAQLRFESHILEFFPPDHRVPVNYHEIEPNLLALTPYELVVEGPRDAVLSPGVFESLDRFLADAIANEPLVQQAVSPFDASAPAALRAMAVASRVGPEAEAATPYLWASDGRVALRATLTSITASSNACHELAQRLRAGLADRFPSGVVARLTGAATLLIQGQVLLLETQVRSFAIALFVVTLVIAAAFRSVRLVAISLVPNLLPLVWTLGVMGGFGVPLNTATVTVAGIALGLIVDDTIHLLHRYGRARRLGHDAEEATADMLHVVGRPVLVTSAAVAAGFAAFAFSEFRPTLYFGLLIALTAVAAAVCDLLVLPALLQRVGGRAT